MQGFLKQINRILRHRQRYCSTITFLLMLLYFYEFRYGNAPALLFFDAAITSHIITYGSIVVLMAAYSFHKIRYFMALLLMSMAWSGIRNALLHITNGSYTQGLLFIVFSLLLLFLTHDILNKKNSSIHGTLGKISASANSILLGSSSVICIMFLKYDFKLMEIFFFCATLLIFIYHFTQREWLKSTYQLILFSKITLTSYFLFIGYYGITTYGVDYSAISHLFIGFYSTGTIFFELFFRAKQQTTRPEKRHIQDKLY